MENLPTRADWQGRLIGRYQLEKLLGRGAMSEVWLATDTQLRRQVAIKILPAALNDQVYLRDFIYEARAAASLEHPHILGIHDFGEQEIDPGEVMPYLVMPYVSGGTLSTRIKETSGRLAIQECLRYLRQAALAIDYAHSKRILHRDIKPANMLLRDDWLLLTDFGLAKILGGTMMRGQTYAGSGTPEYMAPEQIMGQALPASDRYSLAVVAYQLFTGRTPFHGESPNETITQQMQATLPPARQFNPQIPAMVENLLTIALSRNPDLRPPSCIALVDALQKAWMTGTQTEPHPDATLLAPWSKRWQEMTPSQQVPAATPGTPWPSTPATPPSPPVSTPVLPPLANEMQANTGNAQTFTDLNQTGGATPVRDPFATNTAPNGGPSPAATPYLPGSLEKRVGRRPILIGGAAAAVAVVGGGAAAWEFLRMRTAPSPHGSLSAPTQPPGPHKLIPGTPILQLTGHTDAVWTASWHPSGRYLMTASADASIMLWDITTALQKSIPGSALATPLQKWGVAGIKFANITDAVCWSGDGSKLIVGNSFSDKAYVLDAFAFSTPPTVYRDMDLSVLGDTAIYVHVAAGPQNDEFTILNSAVTGSQAQVWRFTQTEVPAVNYDVAENLDVIRWSPDGSMLAAITGTLANHNGFYLWKKSDPFNPSLFTSPQRNSITTYSIIANTVAWSPANPYLLMTSDADEALIWDVRKTQPLSILSAPTDSSTPEIGKLTWSPNGRYVAGTYDPSGNNTTLALSPKIFVWEIQAPLKSAPPQLAQQPLLTFSSPTGSPTHTQGITDLNWSPDGRYLASASFDKTVLIWKVDAQ